MLKQETDLIKCINEKGEVKWLAPIIANNHIRMKGIGFTIFPEVQKPLDVIEITEAKSVELGYNMEIPEEAKIKTTKNNKNGK